ncbi:Rid family hydrolase [Caulobacter sp. FWC26]|uniref:Rid family hydrolase n=1 Tax=Caulobacter sp. FWC26 TaxID=69665 RepID=UPI000C15C918|nr:Rid family hydrolase [Caulobacter sp. FWC26]AZS22309.1 endonuclease [Caulobacter sp. FWC26]
MRIAASLTALALLCGASTASAQEVVRHGREGAMLLESVELGAGAKTIILGGYAAAPLDPNDRSKGFGDTKAQTISTLKKMQAVLEKRGYKMSDMVKMNIFVVADPALGKADYAGVNAGFKEFFLTTANPNTVARTALEIKAMQSPDLYVEIEGWASR